MNDMPDRIMVWPLAGPEKPIAEKEPRWLYRATDSNCFDDIPAPCAEKYLRSRPVLEHADELKNAAEKLQRRLDEHFGGHPGVGDWQEQAEMRDILSTIEAEQRREESGNDN